MKQLYLDLRKVSYLDSILGLPLSTFLSFFCLGHLSSLQTKLFRPYRIISSIVYRIFIYHILISYIINTVIIFVVVPKKPIKSRRVDQMLIPWGGRQWNNPIDVFMHAYYG